MNNLSILAALPAELAWPLSLALAWLGAEFGHRWTGFPRISFYGLAGFLLANSQSGLLPHENGDMVMLLANIAFGLILFEFGYRINLRWLRTNPWLAATGLLEAGTTFAAVYLVAQWFGLPVLTALLLASLAMSTSPATILRIVNEQRSSGQVTERVLHLSAINCILAVFAFKIIVGFWVFESSGSFWLASWNSLAVLLGSAALGASFGVAVPAVLRRLGNLGRDATVAFTITMIFLVAATHTLKFSPILAALIFGFVVRHRRIALDQAQRNFGAVGDLLTVFLFVFVASTLEWPKVSAGFAIAFAVMGTRFATKTASVVILSRLSGTSWRKGMLTGIGLTPIAVFVILILEQTRYMGVDLVDHLAPLATATLVLEIIGPLVTQRALIWAGETARTPET